MPARDTIVRVPIIVQEQAFVPQHSNTTARRLIIVVAKADVDFTAMYTNRKIQETTIVQDKEAVPCPYKRNVSVHLEPTRDIVLGNWRASSLKTG
jgi:hypothetical protein